VELEGASACLQILNFLFHFIGLFLILLDASLIVLSKRVNVSERESKGFLL
jgi:hypothetical protein